MTEPAITPELVAKHNLTPEEYAHVKQILGRTQTVVRLGLVGGKDTSRITQVTSRSGIGRSAA